MPDSRPNQPLRLSARTFLVPGQAEVNTGGWIKPDLIVVCAWMGASQRHVDKYVGQYRNINRFKSVPILVTYSDAADLVFYPDFILDRLRGFQPDGPVVRLLSTLADQVKARGNGSRVSQMRILVHLFSNGGAGATVRLADLLCSPSSTVGFATRSGMPVPLMVLDSSPGKPDLESAMRALALALPAWIPGWLTVPLLWLIRAVLVASATLRLRKNMLLVSWDSLVDDSLFSLDRQDGRTERKLYIFSAADNLIEASHVREHADEAEKRGWVVDREEYDQSGHVLHMRTDPVRYWHAIETGWERAV